MPPYESKQGSYILFLIGYYNKSKECLKVVNILLDPNHNLHLHFRIIGLELSNKKILPDPLP